MGWGVGLEGGGGGGMSFHDNRHRKKKEGKGDAPKSPTFCVLFYSSCIW